ncbi:conserved phage C-terminal domain-containing protein [Latilactobacillus sakei]|uniref:Conserved phage C-terminal domain-containing protein n=1 Tax=Latilactobacillus sakei TaxID=1599 RepID=A0AAF0GRT4_LATSK|nr:conserved phage C-terminal domain-containing protein [Latilactobacillus sakei]WGI18582.1 conserved phage C-terminal domain-containing protein [Latilactobacillus sakei]
MERKEEPNYYAIIPANVRYDKRLIQGAKLLYGEITALSNQKGYCWASDGYFMKLYKVSRKTIQTWLKSLEDCEYISREVIYKEGSNEIDTRYIRFRAYPIHEKVNTPMHEKVTDNTTSFNTTVNNTSNSNSMSGKPDPIPYQEIIDYLNKKSGGHFRNTKTNQTLIKARCKEGFVLSDFKKAIDHTVSAWKGTEGESFLRPSTLFRASKFEGYVNSKPKAFKRKTEPVPDWVQPGYEKPKKVEQSTMTDEEFLNFISGDDNDE